MEAGHWVLVCELLAFPKLADATLAEQSEAAALEAPKLDALAEQNELAQRRSGLELACVLERPEPLGRRDALAEQHGQVRLDELELPDELGRHDGLEQHSELEQLVGLVLKEQFELVCSKLVVSHSAEVVPRWLERQAVRSEQEESC